MTPEEADGLDANQVELIKFARENPVLARLTLQFIRVMSGTVHPRPAGGTVTEDDLATLLEGLGLELPK